ncbi:hypothetical protein MVEN_01440600 [Mycena venus]|uniref:Uncharacterized protein n=1 Tax=Mycena venus TaxID=2733690 RepID=A0A8H7CSX8_9AGAR|nr:hypothetical protein MVEN_01440600 [Mycena venus]
MRYTSGTAFVPQRLVPVTPRQRYAAAEENKRRAMDTAARLPTAPPLISSLSALAARVEEDTETDERTPRRPASSSLLRDNIAPPLPTFLSSTHLQWEGQAASLLCDVATEGKTMIRNAEPGAGSGDEKMKRRPAFARSTERRTEGAEESRCYTDRKKSPSVAPPLGAEAKRAREGKGGVYELHDQPTERARASIRDFSYEEASDDRLAAERRLGRKSEAGSDKRQSWVDPSARLEPAVRGSGTSAPRPSAPPSTHLLKSKHPPTPIVHLSRLSHARIGVEAPILAAEVESTPATRHSSLEHRLHWRKNDRKLAYKVSPAQ